MVTSTLERDVESESDSSKGNGSEVEQVEKHGRKWSPTTIAVTVMSTCVALVFVLSFLLVSITPVSTVAGFGLVAYFTFWLGGGFGIIFAGALVFGGAH